MHIKRTVIFGAGQAGAMIRRWLPSTHKLICFADNNRNKQGSYFEGTSVVSIDEALSMNPDLIWIATLNKQASESIEEQIRSAGFRGTLRYADEFRDVQDIRIASLRLISEEIAAMNIPGAIAELGVFRGEFAAEMNRLFPDRVIYLFDTFEGFVQCDIDREIEISGKAAAWHPDFSETSIELVREILPYPENARFIRGWFPESAGQLSGEEQYAFVNIDPDLYEPTLAGLNYFWPRMAQSGIIMVHDYNSMQFPGVRSAVDEYCRKRNKIPVPLCDLHGTAILVKS